MRTLLVSDRPGDRNRNDNPALPRGFTEWRIWNYEGNNAVTLAVYNGTPQDMGEWLGLNVFSILDRDTYAAEIESMIDIACSQVDQNFTQGEWAQYYSPDAAYNVTCTGVPVP